MNDVRSEYRSATERQNPSAKGESDERSDDVDQALVTNEPYKPTRSDFEPFSPEKFFAVWNVGTNTLAATFLSDVPDPADEDAKDVLSPEDQARAYLTRVDLKTPAYNKLEVVEVRVVDTREPDSKKKK